MRRSPPPIEKDSERAFHAQGGDLLGKDEGIFRPQSPFPLVDFFEGGLAESARGFGGRTFGEEGPLGKEDDGSRSISAESPAL